MWMVLAIGNSRLHWGLFAGGTLQHAWHSSHFSPDDHWLQQANLRQLPIPVDIPLVVASVLPDRTNAWQPYARQIINLSDIPLQGLYPSLGIDRALAIYGAGEIYGYPVLVVDGGTALTVTGVSDRQQLVGGAIWPGLDLQWRSLQSKTPALADFVPNWQPNRWAMDTPGAIGSGILHVAVAGIMDFWQDWQAQFPHSKLLITGGDGAVLAGLIGSRWQVGEYAPNLLLQGIGQTYTIAKW
jgi:type III pantothenate kinase